MRRCASRDALWWVIREYLNASVSHPKSGSRDGVCTGMNMGETVSTAGLADRLPQFARMASALWLCVLLVAALTAIRWIPGPGVLITFLVISIAAWGGALVVPSLSPRAKSTVSSIRVFRTIAAGFHRDRSVLSFLLPVMCVVSLAVFVAGAVVLPRGTGLEQVGGVYVLTGADGRQQISASAGLYLQIARGVLVPAGLALCACCLSALTLRGAARSLEPQVSWTRNL